MARITAKSPARTSRSRFRFFFSARWNRDAMTKHPIANQIIVECVVDDCPGIEAAVTLNTGLLSSVTADPLLSDRGTMA